MKDSIINILKVIHCKVYHTSILFREKHNFQSAKQQQQTTKSSSKNFEFGS